MDVAMTDEEEKGGGGQGGKGDEGSRASVQALQQAKEEAVRQRMEEQYKAKKAAGMKQKESTTIVDDEYMDKYMNTDLSIGQSEYVVDGDRSRYGPSSPPPPPPDPVHGVSGCPRACVCISCVKFRVFEPIGKRLYPNLC